MSLLRHVLVAASLAGVAANALAQPMILPGARLGGPDASSPAPSVPAPGGAATPGQPGSAQPARRAVAVRTVAEDAVLGRELKRNGMAGSLRMERTGRSDYVARVTLEGTMISRPGEACVVRLDDGAPIALASRGRPAGVLRYELQAPICPIAFDILDDSVLVTEPAGACAFRDADCQVEVRGLWGPQPGALLAQTRPIEQARGAADRAVRENYRTLTQRARPADVRAIVVEQAAFSSEREVMCRDYAREATHGFCHARFTEARAAMLADRLGVDTATPAPRRVAPRRSNPPAPARANPEPPVYTTAPGDNR